MKIFTTIFLFLIFMNKIIYAHGECCISRSLAEATISGVTIAPNFGLSLQYEYTDMKTIREGSQSISHDTVLDNVAAEWPEMPDEAKSFSVPTRMIMQKYTLLGTYAATGRLQFLATVPYVINDMDMRMVTRGAESSHHHHVAPLARQTNMRPLASDSTENDMRMDMKMDTVEGLGDMTLMGLYTLYTDKPDLPTKKITLGLGVKTPTGKNDEEFDSGGLVHAAMQPGTGSWDPLFLVHYMHAFHPMIFQTNLLYQMSTEGDEGYEFGDKISLDFIARYQVANYVNPGLELNVFYAGQDTDHDDKYSRPEESLLDNTDNTGITSLSVSPSLQIRIPKTGGSIDLKFQKPLYQHARGIQQVVDWRAMASIVWAF
ncbi:MAG: transporter [Candidatus Brocadia sp.]|nr:transporter [Candidatus Brocadia sp.]